MSVYQWPRGSGWGGRAILWHNYGDVAWSACYWGGRWYPLQDGGDAFLLANNRFPLCSDRPRLFKPIPRVGLVKAASVNVMHLSYSLDYARSAASSLHFERQRLHRVDAADVRIPTLNAGGKQWYRDLPRLRWLASQGWRCITRPAEHRAVGVTIWIQANSAQSRLSLYVHVERFVPETVKTKSHPVLDGTSFRRDSRRYDRVCGSFTPRGKFRESCESQWAESVFVCTCWSALYVVLGACACMKAKQARTSLLCVCVCVSPVRQSCRSVVPEVAVIAVPFTNCEGSSCSFTLGVIMWLKAR